MGPGGLIGRTYPDRRLPEEVTARLVQATMQRDEGDQTKRLGVAGPGGQTDFSWFVVFHDFGWVPAVRCMRASHGAAGIGPTGCIPMFGPTLV